MCFLLTCTGSALAEPDTGDITTPIEPGALFYTGTYDLRAIDPNLTGSGIKIATVCRSETYIEGQPQNDYFWNTSHSCFSKSNIQFIDRINDYAPSGHATAIGAILVGFDDESFYHSLGNFRYEGVVPDATVDVYEFWRFICSYAYGAKKLEADVLTMSVGVVFEDWWTRGIERMVEEDGIVVVAGIGNGQEVCDPAYYPAVGANVIGVGVIDAVKDENQDQGLRRFSLPNREHSSSGPTPDGRCGPDIVAPGNFLVPDSDTNDGYVITGNWSSFATPVVAGTVGLLTQKAKNHEELTGAIDPQGGNCVMKAILLNSATKLPYWHKGRLTKDDDHEFSLDFVQGAGALNSVRAFDHLVAGTQPPGDIGPQGWDNNRLKKNSASANVYRLVIDDPRDNFIVATLIWNRHYEENYPFRANYDMDTDMRMELWAVNDEFPEKNYMIDYSDTRNDNIEHIYSPCDPNFAVYEIIVSANENEQNADFDDFERYGLAWDLRGEDSKDSIFWYDLSENGKVGVEDFRIILELINAGGKVEENAYTGDINMDGVIDVADLLLMASHLK